jgi:ABC-type transporter MlaC component
MYNKSKVLLEQNKSYSKFLKKTYRKAEFQIKEITFKSSDAMIKVESTVPGGKTTFILYLNQNTQGKWKIFKESSVP